MVNCIRCGGETVELLAGSCGGLGRRLGCPKCDLVFEQVSGGAYTKLRFNTYVPCPTMSRYCIEAANEVFGEMLKPIGFDARTTTNLIGKLSDYSSGYDYMRVVEVFAQVVWFLSQRSPNVPVLTHEEKIEWLNKPNAHFFGATPLAYIKAGEPRYKFVIAMIRAKNRIE